MAPLLGFIRKRDRTLRQHDIAREAESRMVQRHALPIPNVKASTKIILANAWKDAKVIADLGKAFTRIRQLTGSCVGAGGGNTLMTLICCQRLFAAAPTTAILPFWLFDYGRCRYNEGDRGQGEGAMGSSFADTVVKEGVLDWNEPGLPAYDTSDGFAVASSSIEMQYSDGASMLNTKWLPTAKQYPLGSAAPCKTSQDVKAMVLNGYPCSFACDNYIGNASLAGSGADQAVCGYWNGSGGHQQYVMGYWENPTLGPLYLAGNNWAGNTYPADPGGAPLCTCWVTEAHVDSAMQHLDAEVYGFSHLTWFAAQVDVVVDWSQV